METATELKNTALTHIHQALGAKLVPFAGYNMPVQYSGLLDEHNAVRNSLGVFDVSHMGEFLVRGKDALALIQHITTNDVSKLVDGKVQYSCMPNGKGGIVDDLLVYRFNEELYMLVVNASNIEKDWNWITANNTWADAILEDHSDKTSLLAVQGPKALEAMQKLTSMQLVGREYYTFDMGTFAGIDNVVVSTTGYTGAGGCEIYFPNEVAEQTWRAVMEAGAEFGIKPIGLGARDTLRLEMGFCLYGNDIDDTTSPIEAGLGWITKFTKEFVDSEVLKAQKTNGVSRKLVGFELIDKGIPRHGYEVVDAAMNAIGVVTSGTQSPSLNKPIGMAYVPTGLSKPGSEILISIRGKALKAVVTALPFYKPS
ncbi:MAG: glycine cleavage system aminomethyltransferase GcvT [Flavobacteriales bacterium]